MQEAGCPKSEGSGRPTSEGSCRPASEGSGRPTSEGSCRPKSEGSGSPRIGRGDNRAVTDLGFAHVTTKTWAYLGVFGSFRNFAQLLSVIPLWNKSLKVI